MSLPITSHLWLVTLGHADPLALKIVGEMVADLFGGEIGLFLAQDMVVFGSIVGLLDEQFARLSALEQMLLSWLAIVREPVTLEERDQSRTGANRLLAIRDVSRCLYTSVEILLNQAVGLPTI